VTLIIGELLCRYRLAVLACVLSVIPSQYHTAGWLAMHVASSLFVACMLCQADDAVTRRLIGRYYGPPKTIHDPGRGQRSVR
jgi:hypothetical protein